jgi:hypothetical protein
MTKPDPPANGSGSQPGNSRLITLPLKPGHNPVVLAEQARRASDIQLRIADWITTFAGSMNFVYLHVGSPSGCCSSRASPWPTLTLIVSLEAIFRPFVMIGQNRQGGVSAGQGRPTSPNRNWSSRPRS